MRHPLLALAIAVTYGIAIGCLLTYEYYYKAFPQTWVYEFRGDTIYMDNNRGLNVNDVFYGHKMSKRDSAGVHIVDCKALTDTIKIHPLIK